jgi:hypothetical protein
MSPHTTVALIGVNSHIGPHILAALLAPAQSFHVVLLQRPSSARPSVPPSKEVKTAILPNEPSDADLEDALAGVDVLISALDEGHVDLHRRLADACITTGVRRFIPPDFGSVRSDDAYALDLLQGYRNKQLTQWHCRRLAEDHPGAFTWTAIVTGHFFDMGLEVPELLGIDIAKEKALLFDGGKAKWSATTREQVGRAVVSVITDEDKTANQVFLVHSFCISQLELLEVVQSVTGKKFETEVVDYKPYLYKELAKANAGDRDALEATVGVLGLMRTNWTGDVLFANKLLGLEEEDLETAVRQALKKTK